MAARDGSFEMTRTAGNRLELGKSGPSGGPQRHQSYLTVPYDRGDEINWVVGDSGVERRVEGARVGWWAVGVLL